MPFEDKNLKLLAMVILSLEEFFVVPNANTF